MGDFQEVLHRETRIWEKQKIKLKQAKMIKKKKKNEKDP